MKAADLRGRLLNALRQSTDQAIQNSANNIPDRIIYNSPTIQLLSARIADIVNGNEAGQAPDIVEEHTNAINTMIAKYSSGLTGRDDGVLPSTEFDGRAVVLLTGSTGALGSLLLLELVKSPAVKRVFAFNRPSFPKSIDERQKAAFRAIGLQTKLLDSMKIVYVEADASEENCGLSQGQYEKVCMTLTSSRDMLTDTSPADPQVGHVDHTQCVAR